MKAVFVLFCLLGCPVLVSAQKSHLSDADVQAAIQKGANEQPSNVGLRLIDVGARWEVALANKNASLGFTITLYTPSTWIEYQAAEAHRLMKLFTFNDVTEDMRSDFVRVMVDANTPANVTAAGMNNASSVDHVVMQDAKKTTVLQPLKEDATDQMVASAISSQFAMHGKVAEFSAEAATQLRGPNGDGEFYVTVIGTKGKKEFKVKAKHFSKL